jgi:predicted nucleotidyltransferase
VDKREVVEKIKQYQALISQHLAIKKLILYGSYARGNWTSTSDIDLAVVVDKIPGDFLQQASLLYRLRRQVDDRIEPLLIEDGTDKSGFLENITRSGETLFSAS